jgi:hypothetical protein
MARDVTLRITFGEELNEEDAARTFAEIGMNCEGVISVVCIVGKARVTGADLDDDFWENRCTRGDIHLRGDDEP